MVSKLLTEAREGRSSEKRDEDGEDGLEKDELIEWAEYEGRNIIWFEQV